MTTDKRITGLSEGNRLYLIDCLKTEVLFHSCGDDDLAAAYEYLAELVESAGREGE